MTDVRQGPEAGDQADEWGTVAGGLPSCSSVARWAADSSVLSDPDGTGTAPNGPRRVAPLEVPAELLDHPRYRVVKSLGKGGMGAVYVAEHRVMKRAVALKVIAAHLLAHPHAVERFRREVEAAARLSHPNIVHAYDAEQAGSCHFLVMELVDGVSLNRLVEQSGPFPVDRACDLAAQAAVGLQHAHEHGMVHRDVKPHNLMLTRTGVVKILDFGLTRVAGDQGAEAPLTHCSALMGTPDFIAPEQARDAHKADIRADIYALGCTLYYFLTGRPPFPEGSAFEKVSAHMREEPSPVTALRNDLPAELVRVLERMMAKDPRQRFQTPIEAARALRAFCPAAPGAESGEAAPPLAPSVLLACDEASTAPTGTWGTVPGNHSPTEDSRTLPVLPHEPERKAGGSSIAVGLLLLCGFGVGGAVGLLNLSRPGTAEQDRARVGAQSKAAQSTAPAPKASEEKPLDLPKLDAEPATPQSPPRVTASAPSRVRETPAAPPAVKKAAPSKIAGTGSGSTSAPVGRGQVSVRAKSTSTEVAIRRRGVVVLTLRPGMGLRQLPAGDYDVLVVGGPMEFQGMSARLSVPAGGQVIVDVRREGVLAGDPASLPPPPQPQSEEGRPPPPPPPPPPGGRKRP
jgi:serine/threonine protein kinase